MRHVEEHFSGGEAVRDIVIGMADGLTVPFALAAGISGALVSSHIVVKRHFTGVSRAKSAVQTALIGGIAAAVAYGLANAIS